MNIILKLRKKEIYFKDKNPLKDQVTFVREKKNTLTQSHKIFINEYEYSFECKDNQSNTKKIFFSVEFTSVFSSSNAIYVCQNLKCDCVDYLKFGGYGRQDASQLFSPEKEENFL